MPIPAVCPHCQTNYNLADTMAGKQVRCKMCSNTFLVGGAAPAVQKTEPREQDLKDKVMTSLATPPPLTRTGGKDRDETESRTPPRATRRDEDDDEEERAIAERRRRRRQQAQGGTSVIVGLILVGCLVLVVGGIVGFIWLMSSGGSDQPQQANVAQNNNPPPGDPQPGQPPRGQPPGRQPPGFGQPGFPPPGNQKPPVQGDILDQKLADLRQDSTRDQAAQWLAAAKPNQPRRAHVAGALEAYLFNPPTPFYSIDVVKAYVSWATLDNLPAMAKLVAGPHPPWWNDDKLNVVMDALARTKDKRAADPLAKRLVASVFDRSRPGKALETLSAVAEPEVLPLYFHPDGGIRQEAQRLIKVYGTRQDVILNQAVKDLEEKGRQKTVLTWLADQTATDDKSKVAVAKALEPFLSDSHPFVRRDAFKALSRWGSKDNVPALLVFLADNKSSLQRHEVIAFLGNLKDPRAAEPLARRLTNFSDSGHASKALQAIGPAAEDAVLPFLKDKDRRARDEAVRILAAIGTREKSLPALTEAANLLPQDRVFQNLAESAKAQISKR